jgi:hypothetical protein
MLAHEHMWGVVLASGREARLPLALDRLARVIPPERMIAVAREGMNICAAAAELIEEPADRGTAVAALVAAMHAHEQDPFAVLVVQPTLDPPGLDRRRIVTLEGACRMAERSHDQVLMIGRQQPVLLVARALALVDRGRRIFPGAASWLDTYQQVLHAVTSGRAGRGHLCMALSHLYSRLPQAGYGPLTVLGAAAPHGGVPAGGRPSTRPGRPLRLSPPSRLSPLH